MQRFFNSKEIADAYVKYRPTYPKELAKQVMQYRTENAAETKTLDLLIDVGCGSGQACTLFQPYFKKILAIDVSEEQIKQAIKHNKHENISYQIGSAEKIPADDESVDMVIAGMAAHWFNLPEFFKEVERVLKPQGCLAMFGYILSDLHPISFKNGHLAKRSAKLFYDTLKKVLPEYDQKAQHSVLEAFEGYHDTYKAIPFHTKKRVDDHYLTFQCSFNDCKGWIKSTDCYENYMKKEMKELKKTSSNITQEEIDNVDLALEFVEKLKSMWNLENVTDKDQKILKATHNNYTLLARP